MKKREESGGCFLIWIHAQSAGLNLTLEKASHDNLEVVLWGRKCNETMHLDLHLRLHFFFLFRLPQSRFYIRTRVQGALSPNSRSTKATLELKEELLKDVIKSSM